MTSHLARIRGNLRTAIAIVLLSALMGAFTAATPVASASTPSCSAFSRDAYERVNPQTGTSLLTLSEAASEAALTSGFTSLRDTSLRLSPGAGKGLAAVHRMYRSRFGGNFFYASSATEVAAATAAGYSDQGVVFYASRTKASCLVPVWSFYSGRAAPLRRERRRHGRA